MQETGAGPAISCRARSLIQRNDLAAAAWHPKQHRMRPLRPEPGYAVFVPVSPEAGGLLRLQLAGWAGAADATRFRAL